MGLKSDGSGFKRKLEERKVGESECRPLSRSFVVEKRDKGQKLAQEARSRENVYLICINM